MELTVYKLALIADGFAPRIAHLYSPRAETYKPKIAARTMARYASFATVFCRAARW